MARLDDNWQIIELPAIKEQGKKPDTEHSNRRLELLRRVDIQKIFSSGKNGNRRNKNGYNA